MGKFQISKLKIQTKEEREDIEKYMELSGAYRMYEELKVKNGVMDFGDLICHTLKLFRSRKTILQKYQEQFRYLLIDEFQDTNYAQNALSVLLAEGRKNITVVGDDDQAIYRFRGAAISNIIQFRKTFPKANIIVLTKNYRSTKEILDRSYDLIQYNNPDRLEVVEKIDKKLECVRRVNGEPVRFIFADRVENEAEETAQTIKNSTLPMNSKKGMYDWKDFAVLVRANSHAEPFIRAFGRHGIPYQFLGPGQLFRQSEVKDLICYLKILYDIRDNVSLYRVLSMDHFRIPARDIALLISVAREQGISLFETCEGTVLTSTNVSNEGKEHIGNIISLIHKHLSLIKKESAGQILYYFLEESGLLKTFTSYKTEKDERVAENIAKFFDKLKIYESNHDDASVFAVVDWLDLSMELGESPLASNMDWNAHNAVNILTVHSAKGLEFPVVFLVNLVGLRFPTVERGEQIPIPDGLVKEVLPKGDYHLEEERRLCYVGATRAEDLLFLTAAKYYGDGKRERNISPFVEEMIGKEQLAKNKEMTNAIQPQLQLLDWKKTEETAYAKTTHPISYLSYSQYESFRRCPLQYRFRHILKIPVAPTSALSFGDTIHRTLKELYERVKKGESVTKEQVLDLFEHQWKSVGYKNKEYEEKMKERGKGMLSEYYRKGYDAKASIIALEQPFKIRIDSGLHMGGKIDRVDRIEGNKLEIIDYKTGASSKLKNPKSDVQLSVYALAASDSGLYGHDPERIIVSFYFLDDQEKVSGTRTKEELENVRNEVKQTAESIRRSNFVPTPGKHCDFCEFRLICEAWR